MRAPVAFIRVRMRMARLFGRSPPPSRSAVQSALLAGRSIRVSPHQFPRPAPGRLFDGHACTLLDTQRVVSAPPLRRRLPSPGSEPLVSHVGVRPLEDSAIEQRRARPPCASTRVRIPPGSLSLQAAMSTRRDERGSTPGGSRSSAASSGSEIETQGEHAYGAVQRTHVGISANVNTDFGEREHRFR